METNVLVTGAAGYIGTMLIERLSEVAGIGRIIGIDLKDRPQQLASCAKLNWLRANVAGDAWEGPLSDEPIDVVIHCAYQIRELYGQHRQLQRRWNIEGARRVFEFALRRPSVRRLVQLSTVSAYGAFASGSERRSLAEETPLLEDVYLYGVQKREVEALLEELYRELQPSTHVVVLRLASVSGPRGRFGLNRYGLLSTVAGRFPILVCGRRDWGRQYLHEDDIVAVLTMLTLAPPADGYQVLNVSPPDYLNAADLGRIFNKRTVVLPPALLKTLFWLIWHGTRGALTTPSGAWKFLSYPIRVDGSRLAQTYGYYCHYSSRQALEARDGRYAAQETTAFEPWAEMLTERGADSGEPRMGPARAQTPPAAPRDLGSDAAR
jgi:nucleoside-diphosphate-sugar epimerase